MSPGDIVENDTFQGQIDYDKYDYSILGSIDPDTHYFKNQRNTICKNYTEESFNKTFDFQNNFSIYHVNIRSTPENLKQLVYYIQGIKYKFSVFAISETWLKTYNDTLYTIKGYSHECVNRENRPGGGVSLYIINNLTYRIRNNLSMDLIDIDILFIEIPKTNLNINTNVLIGVCYRPPHVSATDFIEKLDEILQKLQREKSIVYFCGDFNFNTLMISPAENSNSNEFQNTFFAYGYNPLIVDLPTRVNKFTETCTLIDNINTNYNNYLENCQSGILRTTFSDHYSIVAISKFSSITKQTSFISRREFTEKNKYRLRKKLQLQSWEYIYNTPSVDDAFVFFHNQIRYMFEECFPEKQFEIKYSNRLPWITKCLRNSIDHKNKLHATYNKNPSLQNNINYTKYRNNLTSILMGYSIIVLSGVCDVGSENHSKISGHMTSGERESLIPVSAGFWREL